MKECSTDLELHSYNTINCVKRDASQSLTYAVVLPKTSKQTLICKIPFRVPLKANHTESCTPSDVHL